MNNDVSSTTCSPAKTLACFAALALANLGCKPTATPMDSEAISNGSSSLIERVSAGKVPNKDLQLFSLQPASVQAYEQAPVLSKIAGYVESVAVDVGDSVRKGDTLVILKGPEYLDVVETKRGLIDQTAAQVKQAEAALNAIQAAVASASATVGQAQAGIERAAAQVQRWESENARMSELADKGVVTKQLADETLSQYQTALANKKEILAMIESEQAKLLEAQSQVLKAQADLVAAKAKLEVAKSEHAHALTMAEYLKITAPFDGVITSRDVDAGCFVQPAGSSKDRPLLTITNSDRIRVLVDIPEAESPLVDAGPNGDTVELLVPAQPGRRIAARVTRTSASLDPLSRCLPIQIELDNSEHRLLPGAFLQAKVLLERRKDVWAIPTSAVVKKGEETFCCIVEQGKILHRRIELGLRVNDDIEVTSGLDGSETIVLTRAASLTAGQSVEVVNKK
jgi:RND family efflux transporter MFP subunit